MGRGFHAIIPSYVDTRECDESGVIKIIMIRYVALLCKITANLFIAFDRLLFPPYQAKSNPKHNVIWNLSMVKQLFLEIWVLPQD